MNPTSRNHSVNSSANKFTDLVIPYMDFNNIKALPIRLEYYGKQSAYILSIFKNNLLLTFAFQECCNKT